MWLFEHREWRSARMPACFLENLRHERERHPHPSHLHIRLIKPPGIAGSCEEGSTPLLKQRGSVLCPTRDGRVVHGESSFLYEFFSVSIAERVSQIPPDTNQDDFSLEKTPCEWVLFCQSRLTCVLFLSSTRSAFVFATQPSYVRQDVPQRSFCQSCLKRLAGIY